MTSKGSTLVQHKLCVQCAAFNLRLLCVCMTALGPFRGALPNLHVGLRSSPSPPLSCVSFSVTMLTCECG